MTDEEFARLAGTDPDLREEEEENQDDDEFDGGKRVLQSSSSYINWIDQGKVPPVRNQEQCASCWAFAAVLVQSSMHAITYGTPVVQLSEQQCVDCAYDRDGCEPGWKASCW